MMSKIEKPQPNNTESAQDVLIDAGIAPLITRLGHAAPYRVWVIAHAINAAAGGSGRLDADTLRHALTRYGVTMSDRRYAQLIAQGMGLFWSRGRAGRLSLTGAARLWELLIESVPQDERADYRPARRRVYVTVMGSLDVFKARLYAAWVANHKREQIHASRATIGRIFGVTRVTLIAWDKLAHVTTETTYTVYAGDNLALVPRDETSATDAPRGDVTVSTDENGTRRHVWQGSNVYHATVRKGRIGRQRHIRQRLKKLTAGEKRTPAQVDDRDVVKAWRKAQRILRKGHVKHVKVWIGTRERAGHHTRYYELIGRNVDITADGELTDRDYPKIDLRAIIAHWSHVIKAKFDRETNFTPYKGLPRTACSVGVTRVTSALHTTPTTTEIESPQCWSISDSALATLAATLGGVLRGENSAVAENCHAAITDSIPHDAAQPVAPPTTFSAAYQRVTDAMLAVRKAYRRAGVDTEKLTATFADLKRRQRAAADSDTAITALTALADDLRATLANLNAAAARKRAHTKTLKHTPQDVTTSMSVASEQLLLFAD